jgi:hypothetical protein
MATPVNLTAAIRALIFAALSPLPQRQPPRDHAPQNRAPSDKIVSKIREVTDSFHETVKQERHHECGLLGDLPMKDFN